MLRLLGGREDKQDGMISAIGGLLLYYETRYLYVTKKEILP